MAQAVVTTDEVAQLLDDLVDRVAAAEHAVALSPDGLLLAASRQVDSELADQISSVVAGLQALALAASRHCQTGAVRQIIVQMAEAFLFIAATPGGAVITVRFVGDADVNDIAYQVALFAGKADRHLPTFPEPAQPRMAGG